MAEHCTRPRGDINKAYSVSGWPTHVLIDPEGRLIAYGKWEEIKAAVLNRIWEPKDETNTETTAEYLASYQSCEKSRLI